jgi:hypothetical protein
MRGLPDADASFLKWSTSVRIMQTSSPDSCASNISISSTWSNRLPRGLRLCRRLAVRKRGQFVGQGFRPHRLEVLMQLLNQFLRVRHALLELAAVVGHDFGGRYDRLQNRL